MISHPNSVQVPETFCSAPSNVVNKTLTTHNLINGLELSSIIVEQNNFFMNKNDYRFYQEMSQLTIVTENDDHEELNVPMSDSEFDSFFNRLELEYWEERHEWK